MDCVTTSPAARHSITIKRLGTSTSILTLLRWSQPGLLLDEIRKTVILVYPYHRVFIASIQKGEEILQQYLLTVSDF